MMSNTAVEHPGQAQNKAQLCSLRDYLYVSTFYIFFLTLITHACFNLFSSVGEDGQVKIWSRSGMLRSTLVQTGLFICAPLVSFPESNILAIS